MEETDILDDTSWLVFFHLQWDQPDGGLGCLVLLMVKFELVYSGCLFIY